MRAGLPDEAQWDRAATHRAATEAGRRGEGAALAEEKTAPVEITPRDLPVEHPASAVPLIELAHNDAIGLSPIRCPVLQRQPERQLASELLSRHAQCRYR
jgi:hypothetical protein